jgi:hypothetical protein
MACLVLFPGCQGDKPAVREESASARAQCEREALTNEPPDMRGTLVGAFETSVKAVKGEYEKEYRKEWPGIGDTKDGALALCFYDVPAEQTAVSPPAESGPIERVSIIVDTHLNSLLLHGGPKSAVPVQGIR